jgi:hypothetical protein
MEFGMLHEGDPGGRKGLVHFPSASKIRLRRLGRQQDDGTELNDDRKLNTALGHESIQTTERYLGVQQDLLNAPGGLFGNRSRVRLHSFGP